MVPVWEHLIKCCEFCLKELESDAILSTLEFSKCFFDSVLQNFK